MPPLAAFGVDPQMDGETGAIDVRPQRAEIVDSASGSIGTTRSGK